MFDGHGRLDFSAMNQHGRVVASVFRLSFAGAQECWSVPSGYYVVHGGGDGNSDSCCGQIQDASWHIHYWDLVRVHVSQQGQDAVIEPSGDFPRQFKVAHKPMHSAVPSRRGTRQRNAID
jgi:hypothetical protein